MGIMIKSSAALKLRVLALELMEGGGFYPVLSTNISRGQGRASSSLNGGNLLAQRFLLS